MIWPFPPGRWAKWSRHCRLSSYWSGNTTPPTSREVSSSILRNPSLPSRRSRTWPSMLPSDPSPWLSLPVGQNESWNPMGSSPTNCSLIPAPATVSPSASFPKVRPPSSSRTATAPGHPDTMVSYVRIWPAHQDPPGHSAMDQKADTCSEAHSLFPQLYQRVSQY